MEMSLRERVQKVSIILALQIAESLPRKYRNGLAETAENLIDIYFDKHNISTSDVASEIMTIQKALQYLLDNLRKEILMIQEEIEQSGS